MPRHLLPAKASRPRACRRKIFSLARLRSVTVTGLLFVALLPVPAQACWSGIWLGLDRVNIDLHEPVELSEAGDVLQMANWLARIEALIPEHAMLRIESGSAEFEYDPNVTPEDFSRKYCGQEGKFSVSTKSLKLIFAQVARQLNIPARERAKAQRVGQEVFTIQLAAFADPRGIDRVLDRHDEDLRAVGGQFYDAGGFPGMNHNYWLERGRTKDGAVVTRLLHEAYLSRQKAQAALDALPEPLRSKAFVRRVRR